MICQKCMQHINHNVGDMVVTIRIKDPENIYDNHLKLFFCLKCASELILSKVQP